MPKFAIPVGGLTKLAQSIAGGGEGSDAYSGAFNKTMLGQSQIAQAISNARLRTAQADDLQRSAEMQTPAAVQSNAQTLLGIPQNAAPDVSEYLNTGRIAKYAPLPADAQGPALPAPDWMSKLGSLGRAIASTQGALTLGDSNSANVAKSFGTYDNINKQDQVLNGSLAASKLGQAVAAAAGKPLVTGHEFGSVDNFTGGIDDSSAVAQRFGDYRDAGTAKENEQAKQARASAANAYASAGQHSAQTRKINQDIDMGAKGVLRDTDQGLMLVDPRNGSTRPVLGQDGQPVGPKLKDIPTQANTAIMTNSQNIRKVNRALALVTGQSTGDSTVTTDKDGNKMVGGMRVDPGATGWKGMLPGQILNRYDPKGVDARAEITDIGSLILHDRSGAAVTASESPRLVPFIPLASDDPATVAKKLQRFKQVYEEENNALGETYGPNNGYKPSAVLTRGKQSPSAAVPRNVTVDY